jgi:hypothetical protein
MSEQIQKAFDEWVNGDEYTAEELSFRGVNYDYANRAPAFHGGYTACQSRIRGVIEGKIAEIEKAIQEAEGDRELHGLVYVKSSQIGILREVLGEI